MADYLAMRYDLHTSQIQTAEYIYIYIKKQQQQQLQQKKNKQTETNKIP